MSGKRGGAGRQKGQGNAKTTSKPHFVAKTLDFSRTASHTLSNVKSKKFSSKGEDNNASNDVETPETTATRTIKPSVALRQVAELRNALKSAKSSASTTQQAAPEQSNAKQTPTTSANSTASSTPSTVPTSTSQPTKPSKAVHDFRLRGNARAMGTTPQIPSVSSTSTARSNSELPESTRTNASMQVDSHSTDKATTPNPKKRKAPESIDTTPGTLKRKSPLSDVTPTWYQSINTTDPMSMTLEDIEKEITTVKEAISTLKEVIRLAEVSGAV